MSFVREASPELITPEYWGGIDIADLSLFEQPPTAAEQTVVLSVGSSKFATKALSSTLQHVMDDRYYERTVHTPDQFDPSAIGTEMPDGSVVIVDREALVASSGAYPSFQIINYTGPIEAPFAKYWLNNRSDTREKRVETFGNELAIFDGALGDEDPQVRYTRSLSWGVVMSDAENNRVLRTVPFFVPRSFKSIPVMPKNTDKVSDWEVLPQSVHEVEVDNSLVIGAAHIRGLHRNRSVTVIEPFRPEPRSRRRNPAEAIKEIVSGIADALAPRPAWVPATVPVRRK